MIRPALAIAIVLAFIATLSAQSQPGFEDYPVAVYTGAMHWPKWIRHIGTDEWRDELNKLVERPEVNFAGKYFVSVHSCGTSCRYYTMTDLSSGRELSLLKDFKTREGHSYVTDLLTRANSKLLVAQYRVDSSRAEECRERIFVFEDEKITPLTNTRRNCTHLEE